MRQLQFEIPRKLIYASTLFCIITISSLAAGADLVENWRNAWRYVIAPRSPKHALQNIDQLKQWIQCGYVLPSNTAFLLESFSEAQNFDLDLVKKELLLIAIQNRHLEAIHLLLSLNARLKYKQIKHYPIIALHDLEQEGNLAPILPNRSDFVAIAELLVRFSDNTGHTALHYAAMYDQADALQQMLQRRSINANAQSSVGNSALNVAVLMKAANAVRVLVCFSIVDINLSGKNGYRAIDFAAMQDAPLVLINLLKHPQINVKAINHRTLRPLDLAREKNCFLNVFILQQFEHKLLLE